MPVLALALLASACSKGGDDIYQGWIEGDFIFVSPDEQGRIETMMVRQGDQVKTGQLMFTLDQELQAADLGVAEATLANAKQAFDRAQQLMKSGSGTQKDFDFTQALFREAQARLAAAQTRLMRRKVLSPVNGLIQTVYFRPGETVPPGRAIVSILPPGNVKLRFFVPEPMLARIAIDDAVRFGCDGCPADLTGKISFISRYAEYTPPVIYSQQERHKLVYLVEAMPANPAALRVGQPVDVVVTPKASGTNAPLTSAPAGDVPASKAPAK
jgi:HlyD family secretion protein